MVREIASNRLGALRLTVRGMPLASDLPGRLHRFAATEGEVNPVEIQRCRDVGEAFTQTGSRGVRQRPGGRVDQFGELLLDPGADLGTVVVPQVGTEQA